MEHPRFNTAKTEHFLGILLIIFLGCLVYSNSLKGKFLYDDITLIKYNDYIKSWLNLPKILIENIGAGSGQVSAFSRPIQMITYIMDYSFWGLNELGYHITNIILHILVSLCVYWLANILFIRRSAALLASLLYLVHPVHTEAVAYISGRADPLATLFILLCVCLYIRQISLNSTPIFISILACYTLALFSKEYSIVTPVLLVLYSYIFRAKLLRKEFTSLLAITLIYSLVRIAALKYIPQETSPDFFQRMPGFFLAMAEYVRLLFFPFDLHMSYGKRIFGFNDLRVITGIVITAFLLAYAFRKRNSNRLASFSVLWFIVCIIPQSNLIFPINAFMAEHWLYLPSIGFFLILAGGLFSFYEKARIKNIALALMVCVLSFYSSLTVRQNYYWREPIPFYERTLKYDPDNWQLYYNLGLNYENSGNYKKALTLYTIVLEINPTDALTYYHLAGVYHILGNDDEAFRLYRDAVAMYPDSPMLYYWFGNFCNDAGKSREAIELYKKAIKKDSNFALAYMGLGKLYSNLGDKQKAAVMLNKAIILFKRVVEIAPGYATAHYNLAEAYYLTGQYNLAISHYDRAIKLGYKPDPKFLESLKPYRK